MIEPLRRSRVVPVNAQLPPAWIRVGPTAPDQPERIGPSLFRVGPKEVLRAALIESIDQAREVVLAASFLLSDEGIAEAIVRAAERGRRVYVLTASETRLATLVREDDAFTARMVDEHKKLLDRLAEHVVLRSAEHFHAKLLVCDPATAAQGWVSTANFNKALTDSVEIGLRVTGTAATELASWFNWAFWMESERELTGKGRLAKVPAPPAEPRRPRPGTIVATARDESSLRDEVVRLIGSAQRRLLVASYGLDADHAAVRAILERLGSGVPVTILTRPRPAVADVVQRLRDAGAEVRAHDKLHAKAIVADDSGMLMTANLQGQGLDQGFEVGAKLDRQGADALAHTLNDWANGFPWRFASGLHRDEHLGEICLADTGLRNGRRTIIEEEILSLGTVTAASATGLDATPDPDFPAPRDGERLCQRVRYEWEVVPPRLPKQAKELRREVVETELGQDGEEREKRVKVPYDPPVYSHGGGKLVLLPGADRLDDARRLAAELDARVVVR